MSSGEQKKGGDTDNMYKFNENASMGDSSKWKMPL